jgi:hypothetical protein
MTTIEAIKILRKREKDFLKTESFSQQPGIYAFFFIGDDFPILGDAVQKHQIIYIGKTETSQEKRDAKTHFASEKTGSSTVRKSIGSILCLSKRLKPIPRNVSDYQKRRFSHFKFDNPSEETITDWMKTNLALSFFEFPRSKQEIENLEKEIIDELVPVLNILKNPKNPFKDQLQQLRESCALMAIEGSDSSNFNPISGDLKIKTIQTGFKEKMKTNCIIIDNITEYDLSNKQLRITVANKHLFPFERLGNPITHDLIFVVDNQEYTARYTIGSKDGKSRSGVLKLGIELYLDLLKDVQPTVLKICKNDQNKYTIEKK